MYYEVNRRNGYHTIDQYDDDGHCIRTVAAGLGHQTAQLVTGQLNDAYTTGLRNGARGVIEAMRNDATDANAAGVSWSVAVVDALAAAMSEHGVV